MKRSEIREVIEQTELADGVADKFRSDAEVDEIVSVFADYLGPLLLKLKHDDHASALKSISDLARASAKMAEQFERLDQDYLLLMEDCRREPFDALDPEKFDFLMLQKKLRRLSHAAARARKELTPRKRGAPIKDSLYEAVARLMAILEGRGLAVAATESGSRDQRRKVSGEGGTLLLALFRKFDRPTTEAQLWGAIHRARTDQAAPTTTLEPEAVTEDEKT